MYQSNAFAKTKIETELDFLGALERGEVVTQITLAKRIAVSVGLINALLQRAVQKGYVKAKAAPYKRYTYYLTPRGFTEKSRLVAKYLEISLSFFRQALREYSELFAYAKSQGMQHVALIGGGELAEIALMAAREVGIDVKFVLERATNKKKLHGIAVVRSPDELSCIDGVVITDARAPQKTFDILCKQFAEEQVFVPPLLRVTTAQLDSVPCKFSSPEPRQ